jgi:hypothetical protein
MTALSTHQPWAWMIVHGWKDVENRNWRTWIRGRVLIHASQGMTRAEYFDACVVARSIRGNLDGLPPYEAMERGGIVGSVEIVDCLRFPGLSDNPWFFYGFGFVLRAPMVLPFRPCVGHLRFFDVPDEVAA